MNAKHQMLDQTQEQVMKTTQATGSTVTVDSASENPEVPNESVATILLVDDMPTNLKLLNLYLGDHGYNIKFAKNGKEALQKVDEVSPDLILLDIVMPEMDGYETCKRLKENPRTAHIPILFMSALRDTVDKVKGFELGAVDYLTKPMHHQEVLARVNAHINLQQLQKALNKKSKAFEEQNVRLRSVIKKQRYTERSLKKANKTLYQLAVVDELTRIPNRRRLFEYLEYQWRCSAREKMPLSFFFCDVDYFKQYNDRLGHPAGDNYLRKLAQVLSKEIHRPADLVARYGGDEFAVVMPNTAIEGALYVARNMQAAVERFNKNELKETDMEVGLSIGLTSTTPDLMRSFQVVVTQADKALYAAKAQGRNRIHPLLF